MNDEQPARILVVDDEEIALNNLKHVLKKEGYEVTASQSGPRALHLLEENIFDLVLTDLKMERSVACKYSSAPGSCTQTPR